MKPGSIGLRVRVHWGDSVVHDSVMSPPRQFVLGSGLDSDFVFPEEVLGRDRLRLVRVENGETYVKNLVDGDWYELRAGETLSQSLGAFVLETSSAPKIDSPVRRFYAKPTIIGYFIGALALLATALTAIAYFSPSEPELEKSVREERIFLIRHYLAAGAEREREPDEGRIREAGRPRGAEGSKGRLRFGIAGPTIAGDRQISRQAAIKEARDFGMIGLIPTPVGDAHPAVRAGSTPGDDSDDLASDARADYEGSEEEYTDFGINPTIDAAKDRYSTFAIDVDTGSYYVAKRKITDGWLPPMQSVRPEEFLNAFDYDYPGPEEQPDDDAFVVHLDGAPSPGEKGHHLLRMAVQGRRIPREARGPVHLVYLVDTSGSMQSDDRIGLAKKSLRMLTETLKPGDTVALSTYAGDVREVLPPTGIAHRERILAAIDHLDPGGGTAMASGIELAYRLAERTLKKGEESRVIVLSDGDANIGPMTADDILALVEKQKKRGVTLSTVGFGQGNYKDSTMERLADAGDGNYSYVGSEQDAQRVFSQQVDGMLKVIARDVKIQVEFDPSVVASYRLIGYENRDVADEDFRKDDIDGGEIGAGHSVTAIYDVVLRRADRSPVTVRIRHKPASGEGPVLENEFRMEPSAVASKFDAAPASFRFGSAVVVFAEMLRGSPHALGADFQRIEAIARGASEERPERIELADLMNRAAWLRAGSS